MADYRTIKMTYWSDPYLEDLGPATRTIYVYLFSCSHTNNLGYGEASPKRMHIETAIPVESVVYALKRLERDNKIVLDGKRYWLRNFVKNQCAISKNLIENLDKLFKGVTSSKIRTAITEMYNEKWGIRPEYIQWRESLYDDGIQECGPDEESMFLEEILSAIKGTPGGLATLGKHLKGYISPLQAPSNGIDTHAVIDSSKIDNRSCLSDFSDNGVVTVTEDESDEEKKVNNFNKSEDTPCKPLEGAIKPPEELNRNGDRTGIEGNLFSSSELPAENPEAEAEAEGEDDVDEGSGESERASEPEPAKSQKTFDEDSEPYRVALFLFNCIAHRKPDFKRPNLQAWARHADLMLRVDKRELESVQKVIRWCQADPFWQSNILSTAKLREKFDQLDDRMKSSGGCGAAKSKQGTTCTGQPRFKGFDENSERKYENDPEKLKRWLGAEKYAEIYGNSGGNGT